MWCFMDHLPAIGPKKKQKPSSDPFHQKFNRLQKKLDTLQKKYNDTENVLDKHLSFHSSEIQPLERQMCNLWKDQIKSIYKHLDNKKAFNKQSRRSIFGLLSDLFYNLHNKPHAFEPDEELSSIFKEIAGISEEQIQSNRKNEIKNMVEDLFTSQGIDVDLSNFNYDGTEEEILQRLSKIMEEQSRFFNQDPPPKSKKAMEQEQRKDQLENLQKKGLRSLYKQLAKAFHPDLEIDPILKAEKEIFMKQLSRAYEENDLQTLLSLEMQWLKKSDAIRFQPTQDELKHYNKILQEQVATLQMNIANIFAHPKYSPLHSYFEGNLEQLGSSLVKDLKKTQKNLRVNKEITEDLQGAQAIAIIQAMIRKQEKQWERNFYL